MKRGHVNLYGKQSWVVLLFFAEILGVRDVGFDLICVFWMVREGDRDTESGSSAGLQYR